MKTRNLAVLPLDGRKIGDSNDFGHFEVLPLGRVETRDYGAFLADEAACAEIIRNFEEAGNELVIDYEHATLSGAPAPAAGWISRLECRDGGLWATVSWTEKAAAHLKKREYRYFSPVVLKRTTDSRAVALHSVALTNTPNIKHLKPLVNKAGITSMGGPATAPTTEDDMKEKLIEMLGLKAGAEEAEVLAAVARLKQEQGPPELPQELVDLLGLKAGAGLPEIKGTILALKDGAEKGSALVDRIRALEESLARRAADDLVEMALKAGKLAPAQREWAEKYAAADPEGFRAYVEAAPAVLPLKELPGGENPAAGTITPEMRQVAAAFGHDDETLKAVL